MATQTQKKLRQNVQAKAAETQEPLDDPLRAIAQARHHTVPWWLLVLVFACVEAVVIWLMWPQFRSEFTAFRARRAQSKHDYPAAIPPLLKLVQENPKNATYLSELAHSYLAVKKYDESIKYYLLAQENRANQPPNDDGSAREVPDFSSSLGIAYLQKGDTANAEKCLKQALATNKGDKVANYAMGEIEFRRGNYRKAADYFKQVASDPAYEKPVRKYYAQIEKELFAAVD